MSTGEEPHAVRLEPADLPSSGFSPRASALRNLSARHSLVRFGWRLVVDPAVVPEPGDLVLIAPRQRAPLIGEVRRIEGKTLAIGSAVEGTEQRFSMDSVGLATVVALFAPGEWSAAGDSGGAAP